MASMAFQAHTMGLRSLFQTGEHSDLVLRCSDGKDFNVHKAIVCAQSKFFQKACKPEIFKEGKENVVDLDLGDSATISMLLNYLYTMDYVNESEEKLVTDVDIYVLADFYDVPALSTLVAAKFKLHLAELWNSDSFPKSVETIYTNIPSNNRVLRDLALDMVIEHAKDLINPGGKAEPTALTKVMDRVPELSKEVAIRLLSEVERLKSRSEDHMNKLGDFDIKVQCPRCGIVHIKTPETATGICPCGRPIATCRLLY